MVFHCWRTDGVVELVTFNFAYECYMAWLIILISPYLFPLSLWIQITIHPLSTDGAIVILVFLNIFVVSCSDSDKEDSRPEKKEMITFKNKKEAIEAFKMLLKDKVP